MSSSLTCEPSPQTAGVSTSGSRRFSGLLLPILPLAYFWFRLIDNLRLEWTTNPQYAYGWLVPLLCCGLLFRRISSSDDLRSLPSAPRPLSSDFRFLFCLLTFLYLPTRLVEGAVPEWRPIQWMLGFEAVGLSLCAIYMLKGKRWLEQLSIPICFFLVAIPWPTVIEIPIIQALTRLDGSMVVEALAVSGVPVVQHGNLLEVGTGVVGIDEACSGIRSFQSSLMISLFFGEFYRLSILRRLILVPAGFLLSFGFNVVRTSFLTWIAAHKGTQAINKYHDPAGLSILVACTLGMWALAWLLANQKAENRKQKVEIGKGTPLSAAAANQASVPISALSFRNFSIFLILWLVLVECGVQIWYRTREAQIKPGPNWTLALPQDNPTFQALPVAPKTEYLLRFDEAKQGAWKETDGTSWQGFYFSWLPGRVSGYLAKRHTPDICLPASGCTLRGDPELLVLNIHGVELPVRRYAFETVSGSMIQVFHSRWEAGAGKSAYVQQESARFNLIRAVWAGRGKQGQKILEFMLFGVKDPEQAKQALARQLENLIKVSKG